MASNVTNLTQYMLAGATKAFSNRLAPLRKLSFVSLMDGANFNDIQTIPFVQTGSTSQTFAYATGYNTAVSNVNGVPVTMDTWKYQKFDITDADLVRLSPESITKLGENLGNQLANDVLNNILSTTSSFTNQSTASGSTWQTSAPMITLSQNASTNKWPMEDRTLLCNPALYHDILANTNLVAYAYGNPSIIQDAKVPRYFGFNLYEVDCLPTAGQLAGLALNPNGLGVAMTYPKPQEGNNYLEVKQLTDEQSQISIGYRRYYTESTGTMSHVLECLYGKAVLNASAGYNILVTDQTV